MVHVDLRGVALCTWVAAFAHVLVLVQGVESWTAGSVALVASCLAGALPAIWGASVLLFAPGDANAALDVLLGRTHAGSPSSTSQREARSRDASPEASSARGRRLTSPERGDGEVFDDDGDAEGRGEMDSTVRAADFDVTVTVISASAGRIAGVRGVVAVLARQPDAAEETSGSWGRRPREGATVPAVLRAGKAWTQQTFPGPIPR